MDFYSQFWCKCSSKSGLYEEEQRDAALSKDEAASWCKKQASFLFTLFETAWARENFCDFKLKEATAVNRSLRRRQDSLLLVADIQYTAHTAKTCRSVLLVQSPEDQEEEEEVLIV